MKIQLIYYKNIQNEIYFVIILQIFTRMLYVPGLVFLDSTENPDLCVYCDTAWPHICLPCLRSSGMYGYISRGIISEYLNKIEEALRTQSRLNSNGTQDLFTSFQLYRRYKGCYPTRSHDCHSPIFERVELEETERWTMSSHLFKPLYQMFVGRCLRIITIIIRILHS